MALDSPHYDLRKTNYLAWYEYIVFGIVIIASMAIGIFYGFFAKKNKTREEFLMAGRSMSILPVTLSLLCGFISSVTLLGHPVEIYFYGSVYALLPLGFIPMTLALMYIYVPVYFNLQLTSAYQYFEWRFSRSVRLLLSLCAVFQVITYLPNTVLGPSLALQQVAGIPPTIAAGSIFLICIIYSSIGGLKAVLWTDVLQANIMGISLTALISLGVYEVGGFSQIWEVATAGNRTTFTNFDLDPRVRYTVWSTVIGKMFFWLTLYGATQGPIQRYNSVPTLLQARKCLLINMVGMMGILGACYVIGLCIYTKYADCDPVLSKRVTSSDQLLPYFVMDALSKYYGLPGLLIAGLTCASLSTISSGVNAAAAMIVEDFVKLAKPNLSESKLGLISKIVSAGFGLVSFGFLFLAAAINESVPILPLTSVVNACFNGPVLGAFTLGILFPWANTFGTLVGILTAITTSITICLGAIFAARQGLTFNQKLPLSTAGCATASASPWNLTLISGGFSWQDQDAPFLTDVWNISYCWISGIAVITTVVVGLIFSAPGWACKNRKKINHRLLSAPGLKIWGKIFGYGFLSKWVEFHYLEPSGEAGNNEAPISNGHNLKIQIGHGHAHDHTLDLNARHESTWL